MHIELKRNRTTEYGTDGHLCIDGNYICDTAESPFRHLPVGDYRVTLERLARWKRKMPVLVPAEANRVCGVLGFGNGLFHRNDCRIHVGKYRVSGLVINSIETFKALYDRINNSQRRGHEVILTITK